MVPGFSIVEAVSFGWLHTKKRFFFFFGYAVVFLLCVVAILLMDYWGDLLTGWTTFLGNKKVSLSGAVIVAVVFFALVKCFLLGTLSLGLARTSLTVCDGGQGRLGDLFRCYSLIFKYLAAVFMLWLIWGLVCLPVMGIIIFAAILSHSKIALLLFSSLLTAALLVVVVGTSIRVSFFAYFIIDRGSGPLEALKLSASVTRGQVWRLLLLYLLIAAINLAGILGLLAGLFVTVSPTALMRAYVYRRLLNDWEENDLPGEAYSCGTAEIAG